MFRSRSRSKSRSRSHRSRSPSPIPKIEQYLPLEILDLIATGLPVKDVLNFCRTDKFLARFCEDERVWRALFKRDYPRRQKSKDATYKAAYIHAYSAIPTLNDWDIVKHGGNFYASVYLLTREAMESLPDLNWRNVIVGQNDETRLVHVRIARYNARTNIAFDDEGDAFRLGVPSTLLTTSKKTSVSRTSRRDYADFAKHFGIKKAKNIKS